MKSYCDIGERTKWRNNQYRCVEFIDRESGYTNCDVCGLKGDSIACQLTACMRFQRADRKNVFFRLEPRFRKEEKQ